MSKHKPTGQPVGRPRLNLPVRQRRFLQIERNKEFDQYLSEAQEIFAMLRSVNTVSQSQAVRAAVTFYAISARMAKDRGEKICPRCNGVGYIAIRNGDDDETCECCGQDINTGEIPF